MAKHPTITLHCTFCSKKMRTRIKSRAALDGSVRCPSCDERFVVRDGADADELSVLGLAANPKATMLSLGRGSQAGKQLLTSFKQRVQYDIEDENRRGSYAQRPHEALEGLDLQSPEPQPDPPEDPERKKSPPPPEPGAPGGVLKKRKRKRKKVARDADTIPEKGPKGRLLGAAKLRRDEPEDTIPDEAPPGPHPDPATDVVPVASDILDRVRDEGATVEYESVKDLLAEGARRAAKSIGDDDTLLPPSMRPRHGSTKEPVTALADVSDVIAALDEDASLSDESAAAHVDDPGDDEELETKLYRSDDLRAIRAGDVPEGYLDDDDLESDLGLGRDADGNEDNDDDDEDEDPTQVDGSLSLLAAEEFGDLGFAARTPITRSGDEPAPSASQPDDTEAEDQPHGEVREMDLAGERAPARASSAGRIGFLVVLALIVALALGAAWWSSRDDTSNVTQDSKAAPAAGTSAPVDPAVDTDLVDPPEPAGTVEDALGEARTRVWAAADFVRAASAQRYPKAKAAWDAGDAVVARRLMTEIAAFGDFTEPDHALLFSEIVTKAGEFEAARAALRVARENFPRDARLVEALEAAFDDDPRFVPDVETIGQGKLDAIKRLGGGSTITLRFIKGDKVIAAFKPDQTRRQSNYRAEIAAWRLCQLLACSFDIPYNKPVRLARDDFNALYGRIGGPKQAAYATNFTDLIWKTVSHTDYVYGTQKEWVPGFVDFPIEVTAVWSPWLSQRESERDLAKPLAVSIAAWKQSSKTEKHYGRVLTEAEGRNTGQIAHQLSDVLVFDFLVGNWDRFSGVKEWYGANCQFKDGRIVSIDNGAAFPRKPADKVRQRFQLAERFSRGLILELRLLDREKTLNRLFPKPSKRELAAFELFWQQRAAVLGRVDKLIEIHGEDAVLAFN